MSYKMFGTVKNVQEPNVEKSLQSFELSVQKNDREDVFQFTCFERALTEENMKNVEVGKEVTVDFYINSREAVSASGNKYYKIGLSVNKIEEGNTTGVEQKAKEPSQGVYFASGVSTMLPFDSGSQKSEGDSIF